MKETIDRCNTFLMQSDLPWVSYVLGHGSKEAILAHPQVQSLIDSVSAWPEPPILRHNDAAHPVHQMHLLLDLGLDVSDQAISQLAERILAAQSPEGAYQSKISIPTHFGGSGQPEWAWMLCDFPMLLSFLIRTGFQDLPAVQHAITLLLERSEPNGWRCGGSLPKFRGPGRKEDFCPFATLISLKAISMLPEYHNTPPIRNAIESLCWHWENSAERKIYMFAMGTHYRRLKYPLAWYDLLHVLDVLSSFSYAKEQPACQQMLSLVTAAQQENGGFIPESIYTTYKDWDFGQKSNSSPTLTLAVLRILQKVN